MKRIDIVIRIGIINLVVVCLGLLLVDTIQPTLCIAQTCKSLTFKGGSSSPTTVSTGGSYTMSCDYGAVVDCVSVTPASGTCTWRGWEGTAANFNCTAGTTQGTFTGYCRTFATPTNCCPYKNAVGSLTVDGTAPTVSITSPANNATVSGTINVTANASDNISVSKVEFYLDGSLKFTDTLSPYSFTLDTTTLTNGSHTIMAKAYDKAGNTTQYSIVVTVFNALQTDTLLDSYDVVVVGAGTGGISAAIQAARMGVSVALFEETDWIGGQMTAAGVTSMDECSTSVRDRGIYKEFINKIKAYYGSKPVGTCYWSQDSIAFEPNIGQKILSDMIKETRAKTLPDGKSPILHLSLRTTVTNVVIAADGKTVVGVDVNIIKPTGAVTKRLLSKIVIDATEYGDVLALTPAQYRIGNYITSKKQNIKDNVCIQDITYLAIIKKYPEGVPTGLQLTMEPNIKAGYTPIGYTGYPDYYKYSYLRQQFPHIVSNSGNSVWGQGYPVMWHVHNAYRGMPDSDNSINYTANNTETEMRKITKTGVNWANDYPAIDPYVSNIPENPGAVYPKLSVRYLDDLDYRKRVNGEAKLKTIQFLYYVQNKLNEKYWSVDTTAGYNTAYNLDNLSNDVIPTDFKELEKYLPPIPYIRESRRLLGVYTLKGSDIKRGAESPGQTPKVAKEFTSAVAIGDYPMDLHNANALSELEASLGDDVVAGTYAYGWDGKYVPVTHIKGPFQVPFECFIPETVDGLLVAEKNLSVSRLTNGAIRLQPITMLTGQGAGTIAAVAIRQNLQPRYIDPIVVQIELLKAGSNLALTEYTDVPKTHSFWPYIQLATIRKIFSGYGDGRFGPDDLITRDQGAVTIVKTFGITPYKPATPTFIDVPSTHWAYPYIEAAYKAGILQGCLVNPNQFCPTGYITRAQYSKMLITALNINTIGADERPIFADVPATHPEFKYIQLMYQLKLSSGCSFDGTNRYFCPNDYVNRGQAATFLMLSSILKGNKTDFSIPLTPTVADEGQYTTKIDQLYASWSSSDPESGIAEYQYAIATSQGATDVRNWTSTGTTNYVTAGGLSLTVGKTYYFKVKAKNGVGLWSAIGYSDGIKVQ